MGTRTIVVDDSKIVRHVRSLPPYVAFRPDVLIVGDILTDDQYSITMVETDAVMVITINKKEV